MLRRLTLFLALPAIALALPLTVAAAGGADIATGHGTSVACPDGVAPPGFEPNVCFLSPRDFQFAGVSSLNAGDAHGVFRTEVRHRVTGETVSTIRGRIFCVTATANKAVIGVLAEKVTPADAPTGIRAGDAFYVPMLDNGKGGAAPDLYGPHYLPGLPPADADGQCTLDFVPFMVVTEGDVRVKDGQVSGSG